MSNQISERIIKSRYVIKVQNGHIDFISRFAVFVQKRELYVLALCSLDMSLAGFSQGWGQKWGSLPLLSLVTDASMVRKRCRLLEGKTTQPIKQQAENRSDNCILGNNYSFTGHAFVTRNSNQTTRHSLPVLGTRLHCTRCCTFNLCLHHCVATLFAPYAKNNTSYYVTYKFIDTISDSHLTACFILIST